MKPKPFIGSSGCVTYADTLATVGNGNPERVVPVAELEKLLQRHFGNDVTIKVDGVEFGRAAIKAINEVKRDTNSDR
ncbi:hypothetical protein [Paenibacillus sp. FSL L8-0708]|uniref:hypothetical protein n=1 Tax=Paenibacillus sp. FSL L8-0708 TaxID=2975311 RepID=UPI0030FA8454